MGFLTVETYVEPITDRPEKTSGTIAAKLLVYAGDIEEYYAFITAEAFHSIRMDGLPSVL